MSEEPVIEDNTPPKTAYDSFRAAVEDVVTHLDAKFSKELNEGSRDVALGIHQALTMLELKIRDWDEYRI